MPAPLSAAMQRFVDYFAELGPRWGLPAEACRVHAYLYLVAMPVAEDEMASVLALDAAAVAEALRFLVAYRMVDGAEDARWRSSGDPWDMLLSGLEQRRQRELPLALATLRDCHREALAERTPGRAVAVQMGKMLALAEDLAAIDAQAQRLSPRLLRGLVGISGRAARFADRAFRTGKGKA
jgi:DNA-binding transcriptional regulator GbsR (MarR family)